MTIHILVGTTSGNTEFLAETLQTRLQAAGHSTHMHDQPDSTEVPLQDARWLLCIATHGAGEYAESIIGFMQDLAKQRPDLKTVRCAIVSVGDSSYDTFCQAGVDAQTLLNELNAQLIGERLDIDMMQDLDPEATAEDWIKNILDLF